MMLDFNLGDEKPISAKFGKRLIRKEETFPFKKFIDYEINIFTQNRIWKIVRRYSDFEKLHNSLTTHKIHLPKFPKKKLFNLSENIISERMLLLEEYLNYIINNLDLVSFSEISSFIEMNPNEVLELQTLKRKQNMKKFGSRHRKSRSWINNDIFFIPEEKSRIDAFLEKLENSNESKSEIYHEFWKEISEGDNFKLYNKEDILKLYYGNGGKERGLFYHCGLVNENSLGANEGIQLLYKLTTFEHNPVYELYLGVAKMAKLKNIIDLNLSHHLEQNKDNEHVFKIIKSLINDDKGFNLKTLVKDKKSINKYVNWDQNNENLIN